MELPTWKETVRPAGWNPETSTWRSSWPMEWTAEDYRDALGERYWKGRRHYGEELKRVALHEEGGAAQAIVMNYLSEELSQVEEELESLRDQEVEGVNKLCSMQAADSGAQQGVADLHSPLELGARGPRKVDTSHEGGVQSDHGNVWGG